MSASQDDQDKYARLVNAQLAAHEKLIRDLLVNVIGRLETPLDAFDQYANGIRAHPFFATSPGADPTELDLTNQLISEALDRTLEAARQDLQQALIREHRSRGKPDAS